MKGLIWWENIINAKNAIKNETGARGIRTVIEQLVEEVVFELPDKKNIKEVIMHKGVLQKEKPKYVEKIKIQEEHIKGLQKTRQMKKTISKSPSQNVSTIQTD